MTLVYLYAVAPERAAAWLATTDVRGIAGARVRAVAEHDIVGAVSDVPAAEYDQEPLDRNVTDASWLGPRATAHQEVNQRLLEALGAALPLAFGTLFRAEERLREALRERGDTLRAALASVDGRAEWVVTLDRDRAAAVAALEREPDLAARSSDAERSSPGRAHLVRRSLEDARATALRERDRDARDALAAALAGVAEDATDEPLIEGGPAARVTILVRREREAALEAALDALAREWKARGYTPHASGPWPPYRYAARLGSLR